MQTVLVIGGGPVGFTAAINFAQRGHFVHVRPSEETSPDLRACAQHCHQGPSTTGKRTPCSDQSLLQVYEKRSDLREQKPGVPPPRTVFYGLSSRGQSALAAVSRMATLNCPASCPTPPQGQINPDCLLYLLSAQAGVKMPHSLGERVGGLTVVGQLGSAQLVLHLPNTFCDADMVSL